MDSTPACAVCRARALRPWQRIEGLLYWRCGVCEATLLDAGHWPDAATARAVYATHQNAPDDAGYRRFLARLAMPLLARLPRGASGLDYGCGPGPALAAMLREAGQRVALFDPLFAPDATVLAATYDFITCTEVIEHFLAPAEEFDRFDRLLRPGGWLGLMTGFQTDDARFAGWRYRRDPTHVVFYRAATLHTLARQRGWQCEIVCKDVALMRKPDATCAR